MKYRAEIDGLRALAVVPVILFHAGFELFSGGYVGVDVFFVISGYLITTILMEDLENNQFSILKFYERRARRILPALLFVTLISTPFAILILSPNDLRDFFQSIAAVSTFTSNILFWIESGYFDQAAELKPLLHTWSLAVEEQYYLVFPVFLFATWRFGKNLVFWLIILFAALSLGFSDWASQNFVAANFFLPFSRVWELFAGSVAAFIVNKRGLRSNNILSLIGFFAIIFAIFFYDRTTPIPSIYALIPVTGVVLLLLYGDKGTLAAKILSVKVLVGIGLISYSAYLWHQPVFAFWRLSRLSEPRTNEYILLIAVVLILAYGSWRFVERPFRNKQIVPIKTLMLFIVPLSLLLFCSGLLYHLQILPQKTLNTSLTYELPERGMEFAGVEINGENCSDRDPDDTCTIGNVNSEQKLVIIGDSHARVMTEAAQLFSEPYDYAFIDMTTTACPYLPGLNMYSYSNPLDYCDAKLQEKRTNALKQLDPAVVIVHARFSLYLHGNGVNNTIGGVEPAKSYHIGITGTENYDERFILYEESFKKGIRNLIDNQHKVIIVGGVPAHGWNPVHRLLTLEATIVDEKLDFEAVNELMKIPRTAVSERNQPINKIILRTVNEFENVQYIDSVNLFCDEISCSSITKDQILYSNIDHLSFNGAQYLFKVVLEKAGLQN